MSYLNKIYKGIRDFILNEHKAILIRYIRAVLLLTLKNCVCHKSLSNEHEILYCLDTMESLCLHKYIQSFKLLSFQLFR